MYQKMFSKKEGVMNNNASKLSAKLAVKTLVFTILIWIHKYS